jgi:hypothetical protein
MSDSDWRTDDEPDDGHVNPGQGTQGLGRIRKEEGRSRRRCLCQRRREEEDAIIEKKNYRLPKNNKHRCGIIQENALNPKPEYNLPILRLLGKKRSF